MSTADYNARVVDVLKSAMRMEGMEGNKSAFARLLRGRVGDGPAPNTVGRWLRGEQTIPAWALVACAEAVRGDLSELLGLEAQASPEQVHAMRGDLEAMRRRVDELARHEGQLKELDELRREVSEAGELIARLIRALDRQGMWGSDERPEAGGHSRGLASSGR